MSDFNLIINDIKNYIEWEQNEILNNEVKSLLNENTKESQLKLLKNFNNRISFGTAGLRANMNFGFNNINDLVIIQTVQGLVQYLFHYFKFNKEEMQNRGVIIGYDHRYNKNKNMSSKIFANITTAVFAYHNIKVYIINNFGATPFVAYGVKKLNCLLGIMITASHNPKIDNGYKIYWENGSQIISPHDNYISQFINNNLKPYIQYNYTENYIKTLNNNIYEDVTELITNSYFNDISKLCHSPLLNSKHNLHIAYTGIIIIIIFIYLII